MGSPCEIRLYTENAAQAAAAVALATQEIDRLEQKYSRYIAGNFLDRLNQAAIGGQEMAIDEEFHSLLGFAETCYQQSDGLFDITSGVLRKAWSFKGDVLPTAAQVEALLPKVDWQQVKWNAKSIMFMQTGMELDFGGIVKEYAVDCAAAILEQQGIAHGIVDLGGDLKAIGPHPDGAPWSIAIRHPRKSGQTLTTLALAKGALASSGDYERFIEIDGLRYCHILSPKTGWPVRGLAAVTVIASQCIVAGSACTIAMLKEQRDGDWLKSLQLPCVWMDVEGNYYQKTND